MKKVFLKLFAFSMIALFVMVGCAKAPETELLQVKAGIEAAKAVEADRYTPVEFNALNDSLNVATTEIGVQDSKFILFRSYKKAAATLNSTITLAETVKVNAIAKKEQVKLDAQTCLAETVTLVDEVKSLITKAPKGKDGRIALEQISSDLSLVEASLAEVNTLMGSGDYLTALDKVKAANDKTLSLKEELTNAIGKSRK